MTIHRHYVLKGGQFSGDKGKNYMDQFTWVGNKEALQDARKAIGGADSLSLDTEYDSFRYFRDKLCLIQIRAGERTFIFDPLAPLDISFLRESLADPAVRIIGHAGDNDIRLLKRDYRFTFTNFFDTYRAAMLLGHQQVSLCRLVSHFLGVEMEKKRKTQRSRWDIRPLAEEQLKYAALDVYYLEELAERIQASLEDRGLQEEAARIFEQVVKVTWQEKIPDPRGYQRIKGHRDLTQEELTRLQKLVLWRFRKARETNRPLFMIISDETLLKMSRLANWTPDTLSACCGHFPRADFRELGSEIIELLAEPDQDTVVYPG